ncbi:hypothetical protein [Saccharothrix syringae]|nr:hypothetical protein [Saccharothrix syringae]
MTVQLGWIVRSLPDQYNVRNTLDEVVRTAVQAIPGSRHAGIMMVIGKHY